MTAITTDIRTEYVHALQSRMDRDAGAAQAANFARSTAVRHAEKLTEDAEHLTDMIDELTRHSDSAKRKAKHSFETHRDAKLGVLDELIEAAETGLHGVTGSMLLATVPDDFGRCSPFAVFVQTPTRSYASRNLTLGGALAMAQRESNGDVRANVGYDTCG